MGSFVDPRTGMKTRKSFGCFCFNFCLCAYGICNLDCKQCLVLSPSNFEFPTIFFVFDKVSTRKILLTLIMLHTLDRDLLDIYMQEKRTELTFENLVLQKTTFSQYFFPLLFCNRVFYSKLWVIGWSRQCC